MDALTQELVASIGAELERRASEQGGIPRLAERKDLEPVAVAVVEQAAPGRVEKDRKITIPHWDRVGHVDLMVRTEAGADQLAWLAELKWCGPRHDILCEGIWDMYKLALATQREDRPRAYLVAGAEQSVWETSGFADLYENRDHDPEQLCVRELPGRNKTLAWDAALDGGYDSYPDAIPARVRTSVVGRTAIGEWELRVVEVSRTGADLTPMHGGWPHGRRPPQARRPA